MHVIVGRLALALCLIVACCPAYAQTAPEPLGVIELFTSQGCSSCPPADRLFKSYAERRDLVALSYSVDYWDYLGWKDTLAAAKFTQRQRGYAKQRGDGKVYTPQMVVNGTAHVVGSDQRRIDDAIRETARSGSDGRLAVKCWPEDGAIVVEVAAAGAGWSAAAAKPNGTVWLAVVQPKVDVAVQHGENRGKSLTYYNVVRELLPAGMYTGEGTVVRLPRNAVSASTGERYAVILQQGTHGPIVGAAWMSAQR